MVLQKCALLSCTPQRQIIATTIDQAGADFAKEKIASEGLSSQISIKIEDVSHSLPYHDESFDFIYARLVLHYLPKEALAHALKELYRILRRDGGFFVVVRSTDCKEAKGSFDPHTGLTTYTSACVTYARFFHTENSIQDYLKSSGFAIQHVKSYEEQLCVDFKRTQLSQNKDALIEVLASKPLARAV